MAKKPYMTSNELLESIKRRIMMPTSQVTFTDDEILAFADEEMSLGVVPTVLRVKEDFLMYSELQPLVSGKIRYEIPSRAAGNKLREISFKDANGNYFEMTRLLIDDVPFYNGPYTYNRIYSYYMENNEMVLLPESVQASGGNLVFSFYMRPNRLVMLDHVGIIESINRNTGELVLSSIPSEFSVNSKFDIVQTISPHKCLLYDIQISGINPTTKTITLDPTIIPSNLQEGDHVSLAGESAIPQVPSDLHVFLAHRTSTRILEALGDTEGLQAALLKQAELEKNAMEIIDDRVEAAPQKLVNRHGQLRRGLYSRRYKFRG